MYCYIVKFESMKQEVRKLVGKTKNGRIFVCLVFDVITAGVWRGNLMERSHEGDPG
jgi:hypothetical protein